MAKKLCKLTGSPAFGSKSDEVRCLQNYLKATGFLSVTPTGTFGPLTRDAVKAWQKSKGVAQTGAMDASSRAHFNDENEE